jgi:hypothetical protein
VVVVSDAHGLHNRIESLPEGNVLIHASDFMNFGYDEEDVFEHLHRYEPGYNRRAMRNLEEEQRKMRERIRATKAKKTPIESHPTWNPQKLRMSRHY